MAVTRLSNNALSTARKPTSARGGNVSNAPQFNEATGGTTADVSNYNGTGQTWRTHTFTTNGTFTITTSVASFSALICGGGGEGGESNATYGGSGGGGGGVVDKTGVNALTLGPGAYTITVAGASGQGAFGGGNSGQSSVAFGFTAGGGSGGGEKGGAGGSSGSPQSTAGAAAVANVDGGGGGGAGGAAPGGRSGGAGFTSTISGASVSYGAGGGGGGGSDYITPSGYGCGGGGAQRTNMTLGQSQGLAGVVIVAYRIA